jgi:hypothetical protein
VGPDLPPGLVVEQVFVYTTFVCSLKLSLKRIISNKIAGILFVV